MFQNPLPIIFVIVVITYCNAYKTGAPTSVCKTMVPEHGVPPQPLPSPYTLSVDKTNVRTGANVTITIKAKGKDTFKGLMVQVRDIASNTPVGRFSAKSGANYKVIMCGGGHNTITHTSDAAKTLVVATWTAFEVTKPVHVLLTIAKNGGEFWVGQQSPAITVAA